jgi:hypothetical protein
MISTAFLTIEIAKPDPALRFLQPPGRSGEPGRDESAKSRIVIDSCGSRDE